MKIIKGIIKFLLMMVLTICVLIVGAYAALKINDNMDDKVHLTKYTHMDHDLPAGFDGYKIMMISDFHQAPFADQIIELIKKQSPDIVVFTGDMAQLPDHNISETVKIKEGIGDRIPMYAISGNHERQGGAYEEIIDTLEYNGIQPLENDSVWLEEGGDEILLIGMKDPESDVVSEEKIEKRKEQISNLIPKQRVFSILLSHRADLYPEFKDIGVDLILSGHLHGGIIRLPFIGGLIGKDPERPFYTEYEYGYYKDGDAAIIVSGGCDKNPKKKRYFNPPEAVLIKLEKEEE